MQRHQVWTASVAEDAPLPPEVGEVMPFAEPEVVVMESAATTVSTPVADLLRTNVVAAAATSAYFAARTVDAPLRVNPQQGLRPMSTATANTPSNDSVQGGTANADRTWKWDIYFGRTSCTSTCTVTDRKKITNTIDPYETRGRVISKVLNEVGGANISAPHVAGKIYRDPSGSQLGSTENWNDSLSTNTNYIEANASMWDNNYRIIIGLEEHAYITGNSEQKAKTRTLTAFCSSTLQYCKWYM